MKSKSGKNRRKSIILNVLIVLCVLALAYSAYSLISYYLAGQEAESAYDKLRYEPSGEAAEDGGDGDYPLRLPHYKELYSQNSDFIGWLRVYDMRIDYPVMQTPEEQDYYLHRGFDKKYSSFGCVFASAQCDVDKPSDVITLYGHKMKNGSMFGTLSDLEKKDFYDKHKYIQFDTLKERSSYLIVCVFKSAVDTGGPNEFKYYNYIDFANQAAFDDFMSQAKERQVFETGEKVQFGDKLIMLSTCEYSTRNGRLIVIGKEIPNARAPAFP